MPLSAEDTARLLVIQRHVLAGTDTIEMVKEGVRIMRQDRVGAQIASTKSKTAKAAAAAPVDAGAVLAGLQNFAAKLNQGSAA